MTIHLPHPDTHTHGLHDGCPRCEELAANPVATLDDRNLQRILMLAVDPDRLSRDVSHLELVASANVLTTLERVGHLYRVAPFAVLAYLHRYGRAVLALVEELDAP